MLITIRVHNVRVQDNDGQDLGPHCMAVGYMPSGQLLIQGRITGGHSPSCQGAAVKDVADWLRKHREGWDIETLPGEGIVFYDERTRTMRPERCAHEWSVDEQDTSRCIGCGEPR